MRGTEEMRVLGRVQKKAVPLISRSVSLSTSLAHTPYQLSFSGLYYE